MGGVKKKVDVKKTSLYAIVINSLQILMVAMIGIYILVSPYFPNQMMLMRMVVAVATVLVIWGAAVDIREALVTRKFMVKMRDMETSIENIGQLNQTLRAQRHDFLNHLQVVYSLIEMGEYGEANDYIEEVYGDISSVSRALKTKSPAVNALMLVKFAQMEQLGIRYDVSIHSDWENLSLQGWEMCRILSNLIDNAIDALEGRKDKHIFLTLSENLKQYTFEIGNNGPQIPPKIMDALFMPGVTTKSQGHGMGLFIVKKTLEENGGTIEIESNEEKTVFKGFVPKMPPTGVSGEPGKEAFTN